MLTERQLESQRKYRAANPEKTREASRKWRAANPEKHRNAVKRWRKANPERDREIMRASLYDLAPGDYDAMLTAQGGACAICRQPETATRNGVVKALAVDHCHDSGVTRGLLCQRCNTAIGSLNDDPALIEAAAAYLRRNRHHDTQGVTMTGR